MRHPFSVCLFLLRPELIIQTRLQKALDHPPECRVLNVREHRADMSARQTSQQPGQFRVLFRRVQRLQYPRYEFF